jgi:hypothetical protein
MLEFTLKKSFVHRVRNGRYFFFADEFYKGFNNTLQLRLVKS